jgi:hypothetical protein
VFKRVRLKFKSYLGERIIECEEGEIGAISLDMLNMGYEFHSLENIKEDPNSETC